MGHRTRFRMAAGMFFLAVLGGVAGSVVCAQQPPAPAPPQQIAAAPLPEEAVKNGAAACVQPAPMVRIEDYDPGFL